MAAATVAAFVASQSDRTLVFFT